MTDVVPVLFKKRSGKGAAARKRPATPPPESSSSSGYSSEEEDGARVKRRKTAGVSVTASVKRGDQDLSKSTSFAGDRSTTINKDDDATRTSNWYEIDGPKGAGKANNGTADGNGDGTYKGSANYQSYIQKNPNAPQKSVGPVKASTTVRAITVTDFAPDVCKDYKQTGFCGFGDSCKFLHAREDYKQGWQLDKEWEKVTKGKKPDGKVVGGADKNVKEMDEEEAMLDNIPFACIICREPYKIPVVTKCKHYFCEACALKRHKAKGGKACAACGTDTGGTFSVAKNLRKLLDKKREREKRRKEQAREAGEEVSSDDAS